MADKPIDNPLDYDQHTSLIRAALDPDEKTFFKQYLGQDSPDIMDYLLPQGRFEKARQLRQSIVTQTLHNFLPSPTNPQATLGDARSVDPNFPAPPNAQHYGEAEGPGAPVSTGIYPGQGMSPEQLNAPTTFGTMGGSVNRLSPSGPAFVKEGPRPTTPVPTEDMNAILPRSHQNLLVSKTHQAGLRPYAPGTMLKSNALERLQEIDAGSPETSPNERKILERVLNITPNLPGENTPQGKKAAADADKARLQADMYKGLTEQQIATMKARESADNAKAHDLWQGFSTRMDALKARADKDRAQGKAAGDLMDLNKEKQQVQQARLLLAVEKSRHARQNLDPAEQDLWDNRILDMLHSDLSIQRDEPSLLQGLFGGSGDSHTVPHSNLPVPQGQPPSGNPMQFKPGDITSPEQGGIVNPEPITSVQPAPPQSDPEARKAYMRTMYNTMKDGEVKVLDGKKFQRKGTELREVK